MCEMDYVTIGQVNDAQTLARYIEQTTGTPWATLQDIILLKKKSKEFFTRYPYLDYSTLCHIADWCQRKRRRYSNVWKVIDSFRYAYEDGALPEIDMARQDPILEHNICVAVEKEPDQLWRMKLMGERGIDARKELLDNWRRTREPMLAGM